MKKIVMMLLVMSIMFSGFAFAAEPVPPATGVSQELGQPVPPAVTVKNLVVSRQKLEAKMKAYDEGLNKRLGVIEGKLPDLEKTAENLDKTAKELAPAVKEGVKNGVAEGLASTKAEMGAVSETVISMEGSIEKLLDSNAVIFGLVVAIIVLLIIAALLFFRKSNKKECNDSSRFIELSRKLGKIEEMVGRVPQKTARLVKQVKPITVTFDIDGKTVEYHAPVTEDKTAWKTLYIPDDVTEPVADPSKIVRSETSRADKLRDSLRRSMREYFALKAAEKAGNPPATERGKQLLALVPHLAQQGDIRVSIVL